MPHVDAAVSIPCMLPMTGKIRFSANSSWPEPWWRCSFRGTGWQPKGLRYIHSKGVAQISDSSGNPNVVLKLLEIRSPEVN